MKHALLVATATTILCVGCQSQVDDNRHTREMAEQHQNDAPVPSGAASEPLLAVDTSEVRYGILEDRELTGYFARPASMEDPLPGVILIHEWWGLNANIKTSARQLAGEGYQVLAIDMYNGRVATTPEDARAYMQEALSHNYLSQANFEAAFHFLSEVQAAPKTGVMGWCFGGGQALQAALTLPTSLSASVIFYGRVTANKEQLQAIQLPILGLFGEEDGGIPVESVREFESALTSLDKSVDIHIYPGVGHAFANPSGRNYDENAADDAWKRVLAFFAAHLDS